MSGRHDKSGEPEASANLLLTGPIAIRGLGRGMKDAFRPGRPSRHRAFQEEEAETAAVPPEARRPTVSTPASDLPQTGRNDGLEHRVDDRRHDSGDDAGVTSTSSADTAALPSGGPAFDGQAGAVDTEPEAVDPGDDASEAAAIDDEDRLPPTEKDSADAESWLPEGSAEAASDASPEAPVAPVSDDLVPDDPGAFVAVEDRDAASASGSEDSGTQPEDRAEDAPDPAGGPYEQTEPGADLGEVGTVGDDARSEQVDGNEREHAEGVDLDGLAADADEVPPDSFASDIGSVSPVGTDVEAPAGAHAEAGDASQPGSAEWPDREHPDEAARSADEPQGESAESGELHADGIFVADGAEDDGVAWSDDERGDSPEQATWEGDEPTAPGAWFADLPPDDAAVVDQGEDDQAGPRDGADDDARHQVSGGGDELQASGAGFETGAPADEQVEDDTLEASDGGPEEVPDQEASSSDEPEAVTARFDALSADGAAVVEQGEDATDEVAWWGDGPEAPDAGSDGLRHDDASAVDRSGDDGVEWSGDGGGQHSDPRDTTADGRQDADVAAWVGSHSDVQEFAEDDARAHDEVLSPVHPDSPREGESGTEGESRTDMPLDGADDPAGSSQEGNAAEDAEPLVEPDGTDPLEVLVESAPSIDEAVALNDGAASEEGQDRSLADADEEDASDEDATEPPTAADVDASEPDSVIVAHVAGPAEDLDRTAGHAAGEPIKPGALEEASAHPEEDFAQDEPTDRGGDDTVGEPLDTVREWFKDGSETADSEPVVPATDSPSRGGARSPKPSRPAPPRPPRRRTPSPRPLRARGCRGRRAGGPGSDLRRFDHGGRPQDAARCGARREGGGCLHPAAARRPDERRHVRTADERSHFHAHRRGVDRHGRRDR